MAGRKLFGKAGLLLLTALLLCGLLGGCYRHRKTPYDYPSSTWVCDSPKITVRVDEKADTMFEISEPHAPYPEDMEIIFDTRRMQLLFHSNSDGGTWFEADCWYLPYKIIATVTQDELFDGKYAGRQLVFRRTEKASIDEYLEVFAVPALLVLAVGLLVIGWIVRHKHKKAADHT